jgi:hypothetical protein
MGVSIGSTPILSLFRVYFMENHQKWMEGISIYYFRTPPYGDG